MVFHINMVTHFLTTRKRKSLCERPEMISVCAKSQTGNMTRRPLLRVINYFFRFTIGNRAVTYGNKRYHHRYHDPLLSSENNPVFLVITVQ